MSTSEEFLADARGLCSREGREEKAGSERFFCFSLSIVAKL